MTNGYGAMLNYSAQIPPEDRWAIAAYIRALQFSQNATMNDVPADQRNNIKQYQQVSPAMHIKGPGDNTNINSQGSRDETQGKEGTRR